MLSKGVQNEQELFEHNSKEFIKLLNKYLKQLDYATALCDTLNFDEDVKSKMRAALRAIVDAREELKNDDDDDSSDTLMSNMMMQANLSNMNVSLNIGV